MFKEMLESGGLNRVVPGVNSIEEAEKLYHLIYPPADEGEYGVLAIELKLL